VESCVWVDHGALPSGNVCLEVVACMPVIWLGMCGGETPPAVLGQCVPRLRVQSSCNAYIYGSACERTCAEYCQVGVCMHLLQAIS